ncbi:hypothetical protein ACNPQK_01820 [Acinetobacter guillouiae]|uniref:hypothetical protein n=1 Tax=Acinetobacter guillouiae TaxID=106649 RepID=UPI003AF5887C
MDINKEQFQELAIRIGFDIYEENGEFFYAETRMAYELFQAIKSQATPEGFVLVPKVPSEEILPLNSLYEILDCQECCDAGGFCQERYIQIIEGISKAMIEAQELSHD